MNFQSSGNCIETEFLVSQAQLQPGGVVTDVAGDSYFIQDDRALRDLEALDQPPEPMPVLKYIMNDDEDRICGSTMRG